MLFYVGWLRAIRRGGCRIRDLHKAAIRQILYFRNGLPAVIAMSRLHAVSGAPFDSAGRRARRAAVPLIGVALPLLLGACNDAHPLYGPNSPRNGDGMPVDPVYGTQLPGTAKVYD
jgi:hypothetical protein